MAPVGEVTVALAAAVEMICAADPTALGDGETVVALHRHMERLEAAATRVTAAFDAGGSWEAEGARSAAAWISTRCHLPISAARRRVRLGRELRFMPGVEAAWLTGEITAAHADLLGRARTPASAEAFARDEDMLCEHARRLRFDQFARAMAYWRYRADPEGAEGDARAQREGRRLHLSQSFGGRWFLDGVLDPIGGAIVEKVLRGIDDELFDADWAEAAARRGEGIGPADLQRSPAQRRADALVEMARRAGAVQPEARLPEPLLSVLVGYETFAGMICQLANGTAVTPGSLVPYLDQAWVERVVFDGPSRVKDVGVRRRLFSGATRRAVQIKGQECFHEFCDRPAEDCEVDHVEPWAAGGLTTEDNGRPACAFHNRQRHRPP